MTETFTCEHCKRTFPKGWTDEESEAEFLERFPQHADHEKAIVCDDCYMKMMVWIASGGLSRE